MSERSVPPFQSYSAKSPRSSGPKSPGKGLYIVLLLLLIIVVGIGAAQFLSSKSKDLNNATPTPIEFTEPTEAPSPTPTPEESLTPTISVTPSLSPTTSASNSVDKATGLDRSKLSITVQNGSGKAGAAGKAAKILEDLGYNVVSTGNADSYDYVNTEIEVSSLKKAYLALLKKDLGNDYTISTTSTTYSGDSDAVVIVGAE